MKANLRTMLSVLGVFVCSGAAATTFNTSTPNVSTLATGAALWCNSSGCTATDQTGVAGYATLTAWSTTANAGANAPPTDTGNWVAARIALYSGGGIGITNNIQNSGSEATSTGQHAIDNRGVDDILVVDFGSTGWDVNSFSLGWTGNPQTGATGVAVAVEAWVGNTFFDGGVQSFSANNNVTAVPTGGYTRLNLTAATDPSTGGVVADCGNPVAPCNATGRYLIITGALGPGITGDTGASAGFDDAFKVSQIVATSTGPGGNTVPAPGSLALVALGLLALTVARRRLAAIA